ncbi:MAG: OsmC domain/YcaO domain-containing protein [Bacteriovoracaceae bacterium]|jgi:ribosomal protein S12 methylthiotransferase accessory factor|nr:OsmC domain/YcaO domain-containing protein [Bacteriovoracaceae bacterium]
MQINVKYLDNLKLAANFDDFSVIADQPIRYKGDGTAPGPFDYFLASSALCAAYFVKVYCKARDIDTTDIVVSQNNIIDPQNRYKQTFSIQITIPDSISQKDKEGILKAMDRCTVKRVIQNNPDFIIEAKSILKKETNIAFREFLNKETQTYICGKDSSLEDTIKDMSNLLNELGINIEIASWRNIIPHVWSVHIRDADSPMCYTNGKGTSKESALCSALGEYIERISCNYFYNDYYLGKSISEDNFCHYPNERWFKIPKDNSLPHGLMDDYLLKVYSLNGELKANHLIDTNTANIKRGICALPYIRQSDNKETFIPVNLIGNLFVSNGMSAGNSKYEARVQAISEIFERAVKNEIIKREYTLPDVPRNILENYPNIMQAIRKLEEQGFPIYIKDASLGGKYPVMCVALMNPRNGGVFASFGSHPSFEIALERSLTELLQGRSFEGLNDILEPTFNSFTINEHNNIVDHFIDSTGVISWKFFATTPTYEFTQWDFSGSTQQECDYLMEIFKSLKKEVYISDYTQLGAYACRVLVPNYSEIYEVDDLIWDNNNRAIEFRDQILNLHQLSDLELKNLVSQLEESDHDNYMPISELIGIAYDENSTWAKLDIGELKGLIYIALKEYEMAKEYVQMFLSFNDNLESRKKFYRLLNILLDIELDNELNFQDYKSALNKMYSESLVEDVVNLVNGKIKFYGLEDTSNGVLSIDKHKRLIESYKKLHLKRKQEWNQ